MVWSLAQHAALSEVAPVMFYACALLTVISALAAMLTTNIVRMAVYLLLTLAGVAGFYFMLGAELLGAIQLIVYPRGTLILIIFGVMLTSKNPFVRFNVKTWELAVGSFVALLTAGALFWSMVTTTLPAQSPPPPGGYDQVRKIGMGLLGEYLVPFEVAAVLLLVVMIGAAFLARRRPSRSEPAN